CARYAMPLGRFDYW
nr:immunoglobulin heavy chain junction region [Macaca mulatta]MOY25457.1 immunoglobulin heavy chain junction region [Macaca mulatta]MOY25473.1 immunoglobulin heavy chain junction region [Macaca mulatta]MOY26201.1 immunoglobulin heavy chain junction region [Macaca mulatta]MOY26490.1 immunoglobulin heavy chain junction region [Macaca mulatta]